MKIVARPRTVIHIHPYIYRINAHNEKSQNAQDTSQSSELNEKRNSHVYVSYTRVSAIVPIFFYRNGILPR